MIRLIGGSLYQWDTGRRVEVNVPNKSAVSGVHFCHKNDDVALVVKPVMIDGILTAEIPNILLQQTHLLRVYVTIALENGEKTVCHNTFPLIVREKPDAYVYTETEILSYEKLSERIDELERNGVSEAQIQAAIGRYLDENPVDISGVVKYDSGQVLTDDQKAQARANIGALSLADLPKYDGEFIVIPAVNEEQTLKTGAKYVPSDIKVNKIPYAEVSNNSGGVTATIGNEV